MTGDSVSAAIKHLRVIRGDEDDGYDPEFLRGYDDAIEALERYADHLHARAAATLTPEATP